MFLEFIAPNWLTFWTVTLQILTIHPYHLFILMILLLAGSHVFVVKAPWFSFVFWAPLQATFKLDQIGSTAHWNSGEPLPDSGSLGTLEIRPPNIVDPGPPQWKAEAAAGWHGIFGTAWKVAETVCETWSRQITTMENGCRSTMNGNFQWSNHQRSGRNTRMNYKISGNREFNF